MASRLQGLVGGCLVQATLLLAAMLPISRANPPALLALLSGLAIGFAGGFVAGKLDGDRSKRGLHAGLPVGVVGGAGFGGLLYYLVLTDTATGVFWHFHYLLAVTVPPAWVTQYGGGVVAAFAALCGLGVAAFAILGGWVAVGRRRR